MSLTKTCPRCAVPVPDEAPEGALCAACDAESQGTIALPEQDLQYPVSPTPISTRALSRPVAQPQMESIGDYEVIDKLGQGGMGAVYRARQISLDRLVALKVLPTPFEEDEDFVARFQREATVAARLNHPNLVRVYSSGMADGCHYIAMELIEGENLRQRIKREPVRMSEALRISADVARALQCGWDNAHLIHRDIKPANIYLSHAGEVKLGDLGLAKSTLANTTGITQTGTSLGTPLYMSPEQGKGEKNIDFRSDIYSLGCTLYELLTGKPPYEGRDGHTLIHQHIHAPLPAILKALPGCPMPLVRLVGRMLRKNPRERHASYTDLIAELEMVREQIESGVTLAGPSKVVEAWKQVGDLESRPASNYGLLWAGLALLVLAGAGVTVFVLTKKEERPTVILPPAKTQPVANAISASTEAWASRPDATQPAWHSIDFATVDPGTVNEPIRDGLLHLENYASFGHPAGPSSKNGAVRTTIMWRGETREPKVHLRTVRGSDIPSVFVLLFEDGGVRVGLSDQKGADTPLKAYRVARPFSPGDLIAVQLAAIGSQLHVWVDGAPLPPTEIPAPAEAGRAVLKARDALFQKFEYLPLDGLPEAEALKLVETLAPSEQPSVPAGYVWQRIFREREGADGWIHLKDVTYRTDLVQTDGAIRLEFDRAFPAPQLIARADREKGGYWLLPGVTDWAFKWKSDDNRQQRDISRFQYRQKSRTGTERYELRTIGSRLTCLRDGVVIATAEDTALTSGVFGIFGVNSRVRNVEVLMSDTEALKLANTSSSAATATTERWENLLLDPEMQGKLRKTAEGYIVPAVATLARGRSRDGAVRCRVQFDASVPSFRILAGKEETRWYQAGISIDRLGASSGFIQYVDTTLETGKFADASNQTKTPLSTPIPPGQFVDVELRIVGDTLRLRLNGEVVATARDTRLGAGRWGISGNPTLNTLIRSLEYLDLSQSGSPAPSSASITPATATTDAPFVNSLGMKFVSVPITGGPTDGKRVLFSVWETRVQDYEAFVKEMPREWQRSFPQEPTHPAVKVSWDDASAFCAWLTGRERKAGTIGANEHYRLPTDHEWSCAVGLGDREDATQPPGLKSCQITDLFPWGRQWPPPKNVGNYHGSLHCDDFATTSPVGSFAPNALGLYDLGGNVWEFCQEWSKQGESRVVRGASYMNDQAQDALLCSKRGGCPRDGNQLNMGFRIVLAPAP